MFFRPARGLVWVPVLLVLACAPGSPPADSAALAEPSPLVHAGGRMFAVGLEWGLRETVVSSRGPIVGVEYPSGKIRKWKAGSVAFSSAPHSSAVLVPARPGGWRLTASDKNHPLEYRGRPYRGTMAVRRSSDGGLAVVNVLGVDDYLKGVLPRESVPSWPQEALKAQAVTSRTFLASHPLRHRRDMFDVCASTHCQMYIGQSREDPRTNRAIDATADEILFYDGKPSMGYFYSSCGGMTETAEAVWFGAPIPYTARRECRWGSDAAWFRWRVALGGSEILALLKKRNLVKGMELQDIRVAQRSPSKRASRISVTTDAGVFDVAGDKFRYAVNGDVVRSTLFKMDRDNDGSYVFEGTGWGHGVGYCQWGARGQADEGRTYREILDFYFPGTALGLWARPKQI